MSASGLLGHLGHSTLGVPVGRRRVTVDGAEVSLAVDQGQTHVPRLRHPNEGVIDRRVSVWVVLLQHLPDHTGALAVATGGEVPLAEHRVEDSTVYGLEPIANVRQGSTR